jgi:DNA-binding HxlR family transcriptional regulator
MSPSAFAAMPCPVANALDVLGERWSLLILRDALMGVRRFADFERGLGIAKNILSARLKSLVENGVLERRPSKTDAREIEYRLTDKGRDLVTVIVALAQWGARWEPARCPAPRFFNRHTGAELAQLELHDSDGQPVRLCDLGYELGKAADAA